MRLIDADALVTTLKSVCKPELCTDCGSNWCEYNCPKNDYIDLITDAPTVEPSDYVGAERLAARQRGYADGYHNGMEIGKTLNPRIKQGEWIIVKDERHGDNVKCPFCEKELAGTDLNFCCKCGAKLTGSEKMNGGAV